MKTFLGVVLLLTGTIVGLYAGFWWAFIGGICGVVECVKAEEVVPLDVALNAARVCFAGPIGGATGLFFLTPAGKLLKD